MQILVDDVGGSYHSIDHEPWNGMHLADIVMPWFLFMVGTSIALAFRKFVDKPKAVPMKKAWYVHGRCFCAVRWAVRGAASRPCPSEPPPLPGC